MKVLFLEDDARLRKTLASDFRDRGHEVFEADSLSTIPQVAFDWAVVDIRLSGESGLNALELIRQQSPACSIVILTGYGSIATTVEAMKLGARNYLVKPVDTDVLERALAGEEIKNQESESFPSLSQHEHEYIDFVLTQNKGNISKTAKDLGLHRQSLQRKLRKRP
jgi:two-component system, response regulator RegA